MKNSKYLFTIFMMIAFFGLLVTPTGVGAALVGDTTKATLTLAPATGTFNVGNNFTVSINVNTNGQNVSTVAAFLNYDNTSFQATSIDTTGTAFNTAEFEKTIDQNAGKIKITLGKQSPGINSGNALVAKVNFTAINATSPVMDNITFDFSAGSTTDSNVIKSDGLGTDILSGVFNAKYTVLAADVTPPILTQVNPVSSPTKNSRPSYTFSSNEAGTITYGGDCFSTTVNAVAGNNTVTFNVLADGPHNNCTIKVTDAAGNQSSALAVNSFTIDTVAPILSQVTPVPTPTDNNRPNYTFNSTEAGTITYGGDCSSTNLNAVIGDNTVTFNVLADGPHNNCTIKVTDAAGNQSSALAVNSFVVDTLSPTLTQVTPVPSSTNNPNPSYTFRSSEVGNITYNGDCTSTYTRARADNNTVVFNTLSEGIHNNCSIQVTDDFGHQSLPLIVNTFTIDLTAPVLAEVTPVPPLTNNPRPSYTFSSTEAGNITYTGDCSSGTTRAIVGSNTVVFNTLSDGLHSNCRIKVTDAAGNISQPLVVSPFTIDTGCFSISNVSAAPTINSAIITWNTDRNATSQVNYGLNTSYSLSTPLDPNMVMAHSVTLNGLTGNTIYHFRVRSKDAAGNEKISVDYTFRTSTLADLNSDGYVNTVDVGIMMSFWNTSGPTGDINQDGIVNSIDAGILMSQWSN